MSDHPSAAPARREGPERVDVVAKTTKRVAGFNRWGLSTFTLGRENLAHAQWGLKPGPRNPLHWRSERARHRLLRRRRSLFPLTRRFHPAQAQKAALGTTVAVARTVHPSCCFCLAQPSQALREAGPFFLSLFPSGEPGAGNRDLVPFSVSLPLTHLASVFPPFSVPEAGRSRSTHEKSRSCPRRVRPSRSGGGRSRSSLIGGVSEWHLRKKPKLGLELNPRRGPRASSGNRRKKPKAGTVRIVGSGRLLGQGRRRRSEEVRGSTQRLRRIELSEEPELAERAGRIGTRRHTETSKR
ncbi:PREDICTED: uncharacterized protein LOC108542517 [Rhinopithecus bieti]|uniref:uncharacterized protein LOC108542517 n=1 Tax=Rhinopithecus bieti TaxID=61621 RepID=UPI00083BCF04|nr:PREDICTED: uncharacterized protein LOC108542517 [Rhinopithecus bieti]